MATGLRKFSPQTRRGNHLLNGTKWTVQNASPGRRPVNGGDRLRRRPRGQFSVRVTQLWIVYRRGFAGSHPPLRGGSESVDPGARSCRPGGGAVVKRLGSQLSPDVHVSHKHRTDRERIVREKLQIRRKATGEAFQDH
jgi:hypothetical protein